MIFFKLLFLILTCFLHAKDYVVHDGPHTAGPNCWNGAMVASNVLQFHRFIHPDEFLYLIENSCEKLSSPEYGSVGRIYGQSEVHAFIWINSNRIYAKHSNSSSENYVIMDFARMWDQYHMPRECKIANSNLGDFCKYQIEYYKCNPVTGKLKKQQERLHEFESLLHDLAFSKDTKWEFKGNCSSDSYLARNNILDSIATQIQNLLNEELDDPNYIKSFLKSVTNQIYESEVTIRSYRCREKTSEEKYKKFKTVRELIKQLYVKLDSIQ